MKTWEYKAVTSPYSSINTHPMDDTQTPEGNIADFFDRLGADGWELCAVDDYAHIFKRERRQ